MHKFETVLWDEDDARNTIEQAAAGFDTSDMKIMTRPWKKDPDFTDVGVYTTNPKLIAHLMLYLGGRAWKNVANPA